MVANKSFNPNSKEPLTEIFSQLGHPCAVPVILALGERTYNPDVKELKQKIGSSKGMSVSKSELSKCLTNLASIGLVQRADPPTSNHEASYSLTNIGQEFYRHIIQMRYWAEKGNNNESANSNVSAC